MLPEVVAHGIQIDAAVASGQGDEFRAQNARVRRTVDTTFSSCSSGCTIQRTRKRSAMKASAEKGRLTTSRRPIPRNRSYRPSS
jgi:hypothetical protein